MGYYTEFNFSVIEGSQDLIEQFRQVCEGAHYAFDDCGQSNDTCKWYDAQTDLAAFSMRNPQAIFCLHGKGEDGDCWKLYIQEGHKQHCEAKLIYPEFDKAKLQSDIR